MCGIAGVSDFSGLPISSERLIAMADVQHHRGPDGEGAVHFQIASGNAHWWDRGTPPLPACDGGLAHRRLAIIDLSDRGRQPMHDGTERVWISYNREIYKYVELMAEVILHAYRALVLLRIAQQVGPYRDVQPLQPSTACPFGGRAGPDAQHRTRFFLDVGYKAGPAETAREDAGE
jgi:hypothetical protein